MYICDDSVLYPHGVHLRKYVTDDWRDPPTLQVINTLDPKNHQGSGGIDVQALRHQIQEKDRIIEHMEVRMHSLYTHSATNLYCTCKIDLLMIFKLIFSQGQFFGIYLLLAMD